MTSEYERTDSILPRGAGLKHVQCKQLIFSLSIFGTLVERLSFWRLHFCSDFVTVFFIVFAYARAKNYVVTDFFISTCEKVMLRQSRPGRVKQRCWRFFVHIMGSAEALPILCVRYFRWERERERERYRERDGSDVPIVALKLAMNLHVPLLKIRTFRFSLYTSRLSLHGEVTIVALKFAMSSHFPLPKFFRPLCSPSFKWHEPHDEWSKTQDKGSNPAQCYFVLPIEKMNQINTKNYWK